MTTTTLEPGFLRAALLTSSFRGDDLDRCMCFLIRLGLRGEPFNASMIPGELLNGSKTLAGCATGALIAMGLLVATGERVKSSNPAANGRKVNQLSLPPEKVSTAHAWMRARGFPCTEEAQLSLAV